MKKSLIEEYFDYQLEYERRYGPKTLILMQVGSFFEFYGVDNEKEKIGNARVIADLLNIQLSRRDKAVLENSRKNAQMGGVPIGNIKKYLNVLIANHYTIVMIEQVTAPPDPKREITHIYSPATYIEECNTPDSNIVVSVFLSESGSGGTCPKAASPHYSCGMSAIDITTGIPYVYHISSSAMTEDKMAILEDIYRFVENFNPKEVVFTSAGLRTITEKMIGDVLNTSPYRIYHNHYNLLKEDSQHMKVPYLNAILEKIYKNHGILSGIEYVHLERYTDTVTALVLGIQWLYDHDHGIIERLKIPQIYEYHKHLILYHNAAYQLNLVPTCSSSASTSSTSSKYRSLYEIINKTSTAMGRRLLKHHLLNPVTDREILEERYQKVEWMATYYKDLEKQLNMIGDIERLHRKMALRMLSPQDFSTLYYTYNSIKQILMIIPDEHLAAYQVTQEREIVTFQEYISYIDAHVDVNEMGKYNLSDIKNSFFKPGTYAEIDAIQAMISGTEKYMLDECAAMSAAIRKVDGTALSGGDAVKLEENDRDGYYMTTTARRFDLLPRAMKEAGNWTATKGVGSGVRISNDIFRERSNQLVANRLKIATTVREKYIEFKEILTTKYGDMMDKIIRFIAEIDVVKSHRRCANEYGYHRPVVEDRDSGDSYVAAKGIRHPIIEVIEDKKAYVTNDVYLGRDCRGFLLYGVNGVGKSSLSKAVGINIIMAQMGMYVPSKEFHYYPFTKLFTRINGDDNIFKGMSSFVVEMNELRSILKYSDNRSIVLGDEVCKGTEETSALAIVASTIMRFSERNINFILATHFHKLANLLNCPEKGRKFTNIAFKHLSITIDPAQNAIVYGRKLMDGIGSTNYGVDIARFILDDMEFMKNAKTIRDEILEIDAAIVAPTPSNYHKELFMDCCAICGKTGEGTQLDTHHIVEQHEFDQHRVHPELDIRRDSGHNLVVLCKNHHDAVHHGNLLIRGYKDTTKGRVLDYQFMEPVHIPMTPLIIPSEIDDNQTAINTITTGSSPSSTTSGNSKKSQKKYTEEMVALVISEGEKYKDQLNQIKIVQSIMNLEHKMVIPTQTIKKMIAGTY